RRLIATVLALLEAKNPKTEEPAPVETVENIERFEPQFSSTVENIEMSEPRSSFSEQNLNAGGPSSKTSTTDIDQLYNQSFVETVEMPHTIAERAAFDDVSSDDELIETKFGDSGSQAPAETAQEEAAADISEPSPAEAEEERVEPQFAETI